MPSLYLTKEKTPYGYGLFPRSGELPAAFLYSLIEGDYCCFSDPTVEYRDWDNAGEGVNSPLEWDAGRQEYNAPEFAVYTDADLLLSYMSPMRIGRLLGEGGMWESTTAGEAENLTTNQGLLKKAGLTLDQFLGTYNAKHPKNSKPSIIIPEDQMTPQLTERSVLGVASPVAAMKCRKFMLVARYPGVASYALLLRNEDTFIATEPMQRGGLELARKWLEHHVARGAVIHMLPNDYKVHIQLGAGLPGSIMLGPAQTASDGLKAAEVAYNLPSTGTRKAREDQVADSMRENSRLVPGVFYEEIKGSDLMGAPLGGAEAYEVAIRGQRMVSAGSLTSLAAANFAPLPARATTPNPDKVFTVSVLASAKNHTVTLPGIHLVDTVTRTMPLQPT